MNRNVQILSLEGKDLITNKYAFAEGLSKNKIDELRKNGYKILSKYRGSLDDSLEVIKFKEINKKIIKFKKETKRFYSNDIITINFNYKIDSQEELLEDAEYKKLSNELNGKKKEYKEVKSNRKKKINSLKGKIKRAEAKENADTDKINKLKNELTEAYKETPIETEVEEIKKKLKVVKEKYCFMNVKEIRKELYKNGFKILLKNKEIEFCRKGRSSGSARNGKVNFINKKYYNEIMDYLFCDIEHEEDSELDLPSLESYLSLPSSSIIDTFQLKSENILLINDATSTFSDTVMATRLINEKKDDKGNIISGDLDTNIEETEITNKIFDGEALLDKSIFDFYSYSDKAILQIRNRMYKGIGINTDIQQFFMDNGITSIEQIKAVEGNETIATDIKDIKLITTKSSVKYSKYGSFNEWVNKYADTTWGICKTEKSQHNFNGMAQTHYQLLNTLGMRKEAMKAFLSDTLRYIELLKNDLSVFKLHLGLIKDIEYEEDILDYDSNTQESLEDIKTNSDFMLSMININEDFAKTKMFRNFRYDTIKNYIKNVKKGHVLVNGTYATVVDCPLEYLQCAIGKWDGKSSSIGAFECVSNKFEIGEDILGVRSPQPTMSNMAIFKVIDGNVLSKYFNTESKDIIYISAIKNNIMELESSMDFDVDAMLVLNQKYLVEHCKKLNEEIEIKGKKIQRFLVSTDFTPKRPILRGYNWKDLAETDIACSEGKIGECINLVQMLNSVYWDKKFHGASEEELFELYKDISTLNVLSCIIIDSCKKLSPVNAAKEMNKIRQKGYLGKAKKMTNIIKQNDGTKSKHQRVYYRVARNIDKAKDYSIRPYFFKNLDGGVNYVFKNFETGMDYLAEIMGKVERKVRDNESGGLPLNRIFVKRKCGNADRKKIPKIIELITNMQIEIASIYKDKNIEGKNKYELTKEVREKCCEEIKDIGVTINMMYTFIKRLGESEINEDKFQEYKKVSRNLIRTLNNINNGMLLDMLEVKRKNSETLIRDNAGDIDIYGVKYIKYDYNMFKLLKETLIEDSKEISKVI